MPESHEVLALRRYMADSGLPHRVTSTITGDHAENSRHFQMGTGGQGLAADFAGPRPNDTAAMMAIYRALLLVSDQLRELIFWAPGVDVLVRRRTRVVPMTYGRVTLDAHRNHVHASVERGTEVVWPLNRGGLDMADVVTALCAPGMGVWVFASDGGVFTFGGAKFYGSYPGLPATVRNDATRRLVDVKANDRGGYTLIMQGTKAEPESYDFP